MFRFDINPLTPELNPSVQRCPMRFLLEICFLKCEFRKYKRENPTHEPITRSVY
jgi:hypothetical protein